MDIADSTSISQSSDLFCIEKKMTPLLIFFTLALLIPFSNSQFSHEGSKYSQLQRLTGSIPTIKLSNVNDFNVYLASEPRDYSAFVLLSQRRRNCISCWQIRNNYNYLAGRYKEYTWPASVFFIIVYEEDVPELFEKFDVERSIGLFHIPAAGKLSGVSIMEKARLRLLKLPEAWKWMSNFEDMGPELGVTEAGGDIRTPLQIIALTIVTALFIYRKWERIVRYINVSEICAHTVMTTVVLLVSGHVFNYVSSPAFHHGSSVFYRARRYQFQIEAYIMSIIYMGLAVGFICVTEGRRQALTKRGNSSYLTTLGAGIFALSYWAWNQAAQAKGS